MKLSIINYLPRKMPPPPTATVGTRSVSLASSMLVYQLSILLAALFLSGCVAGGEPKLKSLPVGTPMPVFSVDNGDEVVSNDDLAGKRTLIVFFRTTCPDCKRELPLIETAYKAVSAQEDFRLVAVTMENNADTVVPEYWTNNGFTMPWYIDDYGTAFSSFEIERVPSLYLFGSDGKVAFAAIETFKNYGISTAGDLIELINGLQ